MKPKLSDSEKILRRKRVELQWRGKWRGRTDKAALLDLWRALHRTGCVSLDAFRTFKRENGFYDKTSDDNNLG
jgi:hypothetical protein